MRVEVTGDRSSRLDPNDLQIDELPADWGLARLGEASAPSKESINPSAHPDELFEYYSIPAFQETREPFITPGREILSQKLLVMDGMVLFGKLNPRVPKVWRVRARTSYRKLASTEFLAMSPSDYIDGDFLTFLCCSSHVMEVSKGLVGGSTPSRQRVDPSSFYDIQVPVPPLPEQRAIATVLAKIQAAVEVQDRIVATLKELKAATMAKLFREGLRGEPLKPTEIGEIPASWEVMPCGSLGEPISVGIVVTPAKYYVPAGVPCLRSFNIQEDRLLEKDFVFISEAANDFHAKSKLRQGDVVVVRTGYPGTACVVPEKYEGANCIDLLFARPNQERVVSDYLARYINSAAGKKQILAAQGGLAQQRFNVSALRQLMVGLPSKDEQAGISRIGRMLDHEIAAAESRLGVLRALFAAMLDLLMTGQVRVPLGVQVGGQGAREQGRAGSWTTGVGKKLPEAIERFVAELVRRFEPERVVLFGSHADGSATPDSDVDLLVVMDFEGGSSELAARMDSALERDFPLDLLVRRPETVARAVERGDAFLTGILDRGRALYVRPGAADFREAAPRQERRRHHGTLSEETLREIVRRIVETVHPEKIILFGSAARGEMGPDSDVDLLVVRSGVHRRELAARLYRELADLPVPKDIVVATPEDLERHRDTIGLVYRAALRDGRVVYDAA